jgi:hypothetical protein
VRLEILDKHPRCAKCFLLSHKVTDCKYISQGSATVDTGYQSSNWRHESEVRDYRGADQTTPDSRDPVVSARDGRIPPRLQVYLGVVYH